MPDLTIWKYPLVIADEQVLTMPAGALLLTVQTQGNVPTLWAMVAPGAFTVQRRIRIFGTGRSLSVADHLPYVGTVQTHDGQLVWHVFDGGIVL